MKIFVASYHLSDFLVCANDSLFSIITAIKMSRGNDFGLLTVVICSHLSNTFFADA